MGAATPVRKPTPSNNFDPSCPVFGPVVPIVSLNPYQGKWNIKARVTSKSSIRTWVNARGEGKLFSMDLADSSGAIRATAFTDCVEKFYDMLEVGE